MILHTDLVLFQVITSHYFLSRLPKSRVLSALRNASSSIAIAKESCFRQRKPSKPRSLAAVRAFILAQGSKEPRISLDGLVRRS